MTLERLLAWSAGLLAVAATAAVVAAPPRPPARFVVAALGVAAALPLAFVFLRWLYSLRSRSAGRVGSRLRKLR